ncbi:hypothetical protein [Candidatus Villigracilis affinis]|uniref:hypothetical protein n=1 Tax=Candidatus Villigracilis affinis TaxID=3140682 RepID=UPI002A1AE0EE|nr:hypothetical protein [Anaerolineales bacterium]
MVHLAPGDLEGKGDEDQTQRARTICCLVRHPDADHVALLLGILDYMVTNARVMETVAAADLAAHAGAQEITVLPDGTITATTAGNGIAANY